MVHAALQATGAPRAPQTFAGEGDRARLTGAAVKAVLRLIDAWGPAMPRGQPCSAYRRAPGTG